MTDHDEEIRQVLPAFARCSTSSSRCSRWRYLSLARAILDRVSSESLRTVKVEHRIKTQTRAETVQQFKRLALDDRLARSVFDRLSSVSWHLRIAAMCAAVPRTSIHERRGRPYCARSCHVSPWSLQSLGLRNLGLGLTPITSPFRVPEILALAQYIHLPIIFSPGCSSVIHIVDVEQRSADRS